MVFGIYCGRFYAMSRGDDIVEHYWKLRRDVALFDVPEKPLEIIGPDAVTLMERVFCRRVDSLKLWRARYCIACTPNGGILMDGVLIRLAPDHFWYVQADGEFESWLVAHAHDLDVSIRDLRSRVLQIQGPKALEVLHSATAGQVPDKFGYFHAGRFNFGDQELLATRTGWTGELGFEIYSEGESTDHHALWDHLVACGQPYGLVVSSLDSMGIRRIEAGILDNGTDIDPSMTPYEAGLGDFVDLDSPHFVGRSALLKADKNCLLLGLSCDTTVPFSGLEVYDGKSAVGIVTAGAWSPCLDKGIGYVRFREIGNWLGRQLTLCGRDGGRHPCGIVSLPFYDAEKKIARGLAQD